MNDTIIDLWPTLDELRRVSRLVLVALEKDDLDEVQDLAIRSRELAAIVEEGLVGHPASDRLESSLLELRTMNDRILEVLAERRDEAARNAAEARRQRFRVIASKNTAHEEAGFVNRTR